MFVCVCNAISDRQIKETVAAGATSLTDLQNTLGVATCCGCCADLAISYLGNHSENHQAAVVVVPRQRQLHAALTMCMCIFR